MRNQSSIQSLLTLFILAGCSTTASISDNPIPVAERTDTVSIGLPSDTTVLLTVSDTIPFVSDTIDPALTEPDEDIAEASMEVPEIEHGISTDKIMVPDKQDPSANETETNAPQPIVDREPELVAPPVINPPVKTEKPVAASPVKPAERKTPVIAIPTPAIPEKVPVFNYRNLNKNAYTTGEELRFDIRYGLIVAGEGKMSVDKEFTYKNRTVQRIFFEAKSSSAFSWIYKVHNQYISYLDKDGIYPWKYIQKTREGNYKRDIEVEFDHTLGLAVEKKKEYQIPQYTHDIISAFYYFRNLDLTSAKKGDLIKLSNYSRGKVFPLDVEIKGWQRVTVPAGTFDCVVLEPLVKAGGLFKNEGTLFIWLTNDDLKIPVKVETKVIVGSIQVELREYKGIKRTIPAKVK